MNSGTAPVALVTGAGRGIGRGIAVELAAAGFSVAVNYRSNGDAAEETVRMCRERSHAPGAHFAAVRADIAESTEREALLSQTRERFGDIDALINNAGMAPRLRADILEATEDSFVELMRTNLQGPYFLTQSVARSWTSAPGSTPLQGGRRIVFVTSISSDTASLNRGDYCISKAGLSMAVQLYALRLAEYGIPVFEVRPGIMKTDMTAAVTEKYERLISEGLVPQKRWGTPEDVGRAVRHLLSDGFLFSTGSVFYSDGGLHIARL
ncbi:3-ketoacyl-ACP reductase [Salinispira pacifica]